MARINGLYVLAVDEDIAYSVETVTHPTEDGVPISDTIRKQPVNISVSGKIVDADGLSSEEIVSKIRNLQNQGSVIKYIGKAGTFTNLQIQDFNPHFNNKGADFDMALKEFRTAKSAYVKQINVTTTKKTIEVGDTVKFLGGYVYNASDLNSPKYYKVAQKCKLTKISSLAGAKHIYHLISVSMVYPFNVYGWVDASKVTAITTKVNSNSNGGTQQVNSSGGSTYHIVKEGETLYSIAKKYNVDVNTLKKAAGNTTIISVGQKLLIK